jgi:beta-mannosidase
LSCSYGESFYRWVADETWTFSTTFNSNDPDIAPAVASRAVQLRFYGLDTFATVQLNGKEVLAANNFHR